MRIRSFRHALVYLGLILAAQASDGAAATFKVTIHIPSKSLSIMPYYFGKDKGFFAAEQIEPQLVMMAPPTTSTRMRMDSRNANTAPMRRRRRCGLMS